jgi:amino acid adenylation domain-containing protein
MIERADLDAIIVDRQSLPALADALSGLSNAPHILLTDCNREEALCEIAFDSGELSTSPAMKSPCAMARSDTAYLLFTSGSTGEPKGVPVTNGNARAFMEYNHERYRLGPQDRLSQTFDHTFDLSIFDMFMAWRAGAALCVPKIADLASPASFIARNGITVWFSVPSIGMRLLRQGELTPSSMPGLRWSLFCGEALPQKLAEAWQAAAPNSILENLYGPTELTIACAAYRWNATTSARLCENELVPLGKVFPALSEIVVDERLEPVAPGMPGELCVSGPQTFPGYWQAPALTSKACFEVTNGDGGKVRYYRTGDIVRRRADGEYVFLGRRDSQVKIRGHRIELGEIEAALRSAGCIDAVALAWPSRDQADSIVAFVTGQMPPQLVGRHIRERLPRQMVPRIIEPLSTMPLNVNGKIDRLALHDLAVTRFGVA